MITLPGLYRCYVRIVEDPEYRGRIRVECPQVLGTETLLPWALPCFPYGGSEDIGMFSIPPIDSVVWVMFEEGDPNKPVWMGSWIPAPGGDTRAPLEGVVNEGSGDRWPNNSTVGEGKDDNAVIPVMEPNKIDPTNHVLIRTPEGHTIECDDTPGQEKVVIRDKLGQFVLIRSAEGKTKILIKDAEGQYILFDAESGQRKIRIEDASGNFVLLDAEENSVRLEDVVGDYINLRAGVIDIIAKADVNIKATSSNILVQADGGSVRVVSTGGLVDVDAPGGSVNVDADAINLAEDSGGLAKVARIGDVVTVGSGSSAGDWPITSGSDVVKAGG